MNDWIFSLQRQLKYIFFSKGQVRSVYWIQVPSVFPKGNILKKMTEIPLTFPPVDIPPGQSSLCMCLSLALSKKK
jgi:hypothetical protein